MASNFTENVCEEAGVGGSLCVFLSYGAVEVTLLELLNVNFILKNHSKRYVMIEKPNHLYCQITSALLKCLIYKHVKYRCL